jgi:predicted dehydrogenase
LDMTADDHYSAILKFKNKISGNIIIDLLSKKPFRTLRIIGSEGVLDWEWQDNQIKLFRGNKIDHSAGYDWQKIDLKRGKSEKGYITTEDMYEEEIDHFLKAIEGKERYPFTFRESLEHLEALFALEKSAKTKKQVSLK